MNGQHVELLVAVEGKAEPGLALLECKVQMAVWETTLKHALALPE